jgi:hypothetical protein
MNPTTRPAVFADTAILVLARFAPPMPFRT